MIGKRGRGEKMRGGERHNVNDEKEKERRQKSSHENFTEYDSSECRIYSAVC